MTICQIVVVLVMLPFAASARGDESRPNVFIAISDDQSWPHASAYGSKMVLTPSFDRIAREGTLFTHAFCASPGCSPSRAALLTGRNTWQVEHAGTHGSWFHSKYVTFPEVLQKAGYIVGHTGKGWGPGDFTRLGRAHNPAGPDFSGRQGVGPKDSYLAALERFLSERSQDQPFCFWFGSRDPHRSYEQGSGQSQGKKLEDAEVPPFLPDAPVIRSDLLDYATEIERFDDDLAKMLDLLEQAGELDNTLVIVTSDNGMPFPRAKANCYEYGIRLPLAIRWGKHGSSGRVVDDLISFTDLTATIFEATGTMSEGISLEGKSIVPILNSAEEGIVDSSRTAVFSARERHSSSRFNTLGYPQRAIRTRDFLYIRNFKPERWPAGAPRKFKVVIYSEQSEVVKSKMASTQEAYHDIDSSPTLSYLMAHQHDSNVKKYFNLAVGKRPAEELFDITSDPGCLKNLADDPQYVAEKEKLASRLMDYLRTTEDPRIVGDGDVWETYPRVGKLRWFPLPDWAKISPESVPTQLWLEERRPRR